MGWLVNKRNKKWAGKLGWEPSDFGKGLEDFNNELAIAITYFQKLIKDSGHDIDVDGVCGPATYRFLVSEKKKAILNPTSARIHKILSDRTGNPGTHLLIEGQWVDIGWPTMYRPLPSDCFKKVKKTRNPSVVVVHHDAALSADSCRSILMNSGISTHVCIDNDGVIQQYVDLNDITWHAGVSYYRKNGVKTKYRSRELNNRSIGVDFSNAWYTKYNKKYERMGFGKRPVIKDSRIHGVKMKEHLGMYPQQLAAFRTLSKFLAEHFDIPAEVPLDDDGNFKRGWVEECMKAEFSGFQVHFNSSINKIDTDIDLKELVCS
jgi:hypothetical protein